MELEMIYLKEDPEVSGIHEAPLILRKPRWSLAHNNKEIFMGEPEAFTHSLVFTNGVHVKDGRVQNGHELIHVHKLCDEFRTFKYVRTKFFQSHVYHEQY